MGEIICQFNKSIGLLNFGVIIEKVNRFTNFGNYAKGTVYQNKNIVDTLWFANKTECQQKINTLNKLYQYYNSIDTSYLSYDELKYILDQNGEFDKLSFLIRFQGSSWFKRFVETNHYECKFYHTGEIDPTSESFPDDYCLLGNKERETYYLDKTEIINNNQILKVDYHAYRESMQSKSFSLPKNFFICLRVALYLHILFYIVKYNKYISYFPTSLNAQVPWEVKYFINDYKLYPTSI